VCWLHGQRIGARVPLNANLHGAARGLLDRYEINPKGDASSVMESQSHHCPACGREFKRILDYPRVQVCCFERLPIPEAVDTMSGAAAEKQLARQRREGTAKFEVSAGGINMTPAIEQACSAPEVQQYFECLARLVGEVVEPRRLLPPLAAHGRFKWAYPVADTGICLSLREAENVGGQRRAAEVQVHCTGPNLGSAGGPTLQSLGAVARLEYEGLLEEGFA